MTIQNKKIPLKFKNHTFGFTLVELIVVITILAILGTIAFVSFGSYSSSARDSKRISNLSLLDKGFGMAIAGGKTINTSESLSGSEYNIFINGSGLTLSGVFDSPIKPKLLMSIGVTSEELSLNDGSNIYKYTYIPSTRQYQVMVGLENKPGTSYFIGGLQKKFAEDTSSSSYPFIKGNYVETGSIVGLIPTEEACPTGSTSCTVTGTIDYMITADSVIEVSETPVTPTGSGCIFDNADSKFDSCTFSL